MSTFFYKVENNVFWSKAERFILEKNKEAFFVNSTLGSWVRVFRIFIGPCWKSQKWRVYSVTIQPLIYRALYQNKPTKFVTSSCILIKTIHTGPNYFGLIYLKSRKFSHIPKLKIPKFPKIQKLIFSNLISKFCVKIDELID